MAGGFYVTIILGFRFNLQSVCSFISFTFNQAKNEENQQYGFYWDFLVLHGFVNLDYAI